MGMAKSRRTSCAFEQLLKTLLNSYSLIQLEKITNISKNTWYRWNNNKHKPQYRNLIKLSNIFNVKMTIED